MALSSFEIQQWGPPKLQKILKQIEDAINQRAPIPGLGIDVDELADGREITIKAEAQKQRAEKGGLALGGSGTGSDLEGALNGAPATFHLSQTAPPTPRPLT